MRISHQEPPVVETFSSLGALWQLWGGACELLLIDVPVGLSQSEASRECDRQARRFLGAPRASSVFNPPARAALQASSWQDAARLNQAATGKRISRQGWGIIPKIREVDGFMRENPALQSVIREVHPEVLFAALNGGEAASHSKKQSAGVEERLQILEKHHRGAADVARQAFHDFPRRHVQRDDVVDALAAATTAFRYHEALRSMPADPPVDIHGLRMEIVIPDLESSSLTAG